MPMRFSAAALLLGLAAAPASAGTCHMTVQGAPVLDDVECSLELGRRGDAVVTLGDGGTVTVRRDVLRARLLGRPRPDGSRRFFARSFGPVLASGERDTSLCYFNQKATLCVEP